MNMIDVAVEKSKAPAAKVEAVLMIMFYRDEAGDENTVCSSAGANNPHIFAMLTKLFELWANNSLSGLSISWNPEQS